MPQASTRYIEPDSSIDFGPAKVLELTLPVDPDRSLLAQPETDEEEGVSGHDGESVGPAGMWGTGPRERAGAR